MKNIFGLFFPSVSAEEICILDGDGLPCSQVEETAKWILGGGFVFIILLLVFCIAAVIFWGAMVAHASLKPIPKKTFWIIIMMLLGFPGAVAYYFIVRRRFKENKESLNLPVPPPPPPAIPNF